MRLQRVGTRRVGDKNYYKYVVTLPEEVLRSLGWKPGIDLSIKVRGHEVVLASMGSRKATRKVSQTGGSGYPEFCETIRRELATHKAGLTWSQIRDDLQLPQKVPNNGWVRQMEKDIGLLRVKTAGGTIWRLK